MNFDFGKNFETNLFIATGCRYYQWTSLDSFKNKGYSRHCDPVLVWFNIDLHLSLIIYFFQLPTFSNKLRKQAPIANIQTSYLYLNAVRPLILSSSISNTLWLFYVKYLILSAEDKLKQKEWWGKLEGIIGPFSK